MQLTITRHKGKDGGKMRNMRSLNTSVLLNPFCQRETAKNIICSECYAKGIIHQYNKCKFKSWALNTKLLSENVLDYKELPAIRAGELFRLHSMGELMNLTHYENFLRIAEKNPKIKFALWSKRADIIRKVSTVPENIILIYSTPKINGVPRIPAKFHKVFTVYNASYALKKRVDVNCDAECLTCRLCYDRETTGTINEVLKSEAHLYRRGL